jgi:hypothetical protein
MITHLITTTEFVKFIQKLNLLDFTPKHTKLEMIYMYANFISQKPTEELLRKYIKNINSIKFDEKYIIISIADSCNIYIDKDNEDVFYSSDMYLIPTLEYLVEFIKLELTEAALKEIGL